MRHQRPGLVQRADKCQSQRARGLRGSLRNSRTSRDCGSIRLSPEPVPARCRRRGFAASSTLSLPKTALRAVGGIVAYRCITTSSSRVVADQAVAVGADLAGCRPARATGRARGDLERAGADGQELRGPPHRIPNKRERRPAGYLHPQQAAVGVGETGGGQWLPACVPAELRQLTSSKSSNRLAAKVVARSPYVLLRRLLPLPWACAHVVRRSAGAPAIGPRMCWNAVPRVEPGQAALHRYRSHQSERSTVRLPIDAFGSSPDGLSPGRSQCVSPPAGSNLRPCLRPERRATANRADRRPSRSWAFVLDRPQARRTTLVSDAVDAGSGHREQSVLRIDSRSPTFPTGKGTRVPAPARAARAAAGQNAS